MIRAEKIKIANTFFVDAREYNEEIRIGALSLLTLIFNKNIFENYTSSIENLVFAVENKLQTNASNVLMKKFGLDGKGIRSYDKVREELPYISVYMIRSNYREGLKELKYINFDLISFKR